MTVVRTRFSPSPTGRIHLGNLRTALFSALYAKKNKGVFILRIEDTDMTRSSEEHVEALQNDLHWIGIDWQEGPGVHGEYGPYWQSQRQDIYAHYYTLLENENLAYPCFCTDQELILSRKLQLSRGQAPRYAGTCLHLSKEEITKQINAGKKPAWRFRVPAHTLIQFDDIVKGPQTFNSEEIGDFIIRRVDGTAPFLFCNAIDDAAMKVSHVIRGEDHLSNTPRQILLLKTLNLPIPQYGHLSLIVGEDGAPLSKRHGSFSLHEMKSQGYLAIALLNYLARLGHACETPLLLPFDQLADYFQIDKLSRSPSRFDTIQLLHWQKMAVQALDAALFWRWLGESVHAQIPEKKRDVFVKTIQVNVEFPHDALLWAKIFFHDVIVYDARAKQIIHDAGEQFFVEAENAVDKYGIDLKLVLDEMKQTLGVSGKKLYQPLRIALTGRSHGPELQPIAELLGQTKIKHRLSKAFQSAKAE